MHPLADCFLLCTMLKYVHYYLLLRYQLFKLWEPLSEGTEAQLCQSASACQLEINLYIKR